MLWEDNNPQGKAWTTCLDNLKGSEKIQYLKEHKRGLQQSKEDGSVYVLTIYYGLYVYLPLYLQLKQEYDIFKNMHTQSRWGWDNEKNVPDISDDVWRAYLNVSLSYIMQP